MAGRLFPPGYQAIDGNGAPMSGAKLYFYEAGTSTPADTYADDDLATANANPVVADSAGRFGPIFGGASDYKAILKTSAGVTVFTADPVTPSGAATGATQSEVDARLSTTKFVTPATLAEGLGLQGSSVASAASLNIPDVGDYFNVTGTTAITALESRTAGREITLLFAAALTLTHNATSLILPGAADIVTAAGDTARFRSEGSGNWRCTDYQRAAFAAIDKATQAEMEAQTAGKVVTADNIKYAPMIAKAWANVTVSGTTYTLQSKYNVASINRTGVGVVTVTIDTDLSGTNYAAIVTPNDLGAYATASSLAAGSLTVTLRTGASSTAVESGFSIVVFGDF